MEEDQDSQRCVGTGSADRRRETYQQGDRQT
jgi:hypothetical protein